MQQSTVALAIRTGFIVLIAAALMLSGVFVDMLLGTIPLGTLCSLAIGSIFGTIMIIVVIRSSFPTDSAGPIGKEEAKDAGQSGDSAADNARRAGP